MASTPKRTVRVTVDGKSYEADINRLTFAEAKAVERKSGESIAEIMRTKSMAAVQALIWVIVKRGEPTFKYEDLDDREVADFDIEEVPVDAEVATEADPTEAGTPAWKIDSSAT